MKLFTIPNFLTLGNLLCGSLSILFLTGQFGTQAENIPIIILLLLAGSLLLDLLDGMVARALNIHSELGVQMDSLADMVSFGVVPGLLLYKTIESIQDLEFFKYAGLVVILFSALRLAKFNVDTEQKTYFKGLATPANTLLIFSIYWIFEKTNDPVNPHISHLLAVLGLILSWLLISNIPLFSFKFKSLGWKENNYKYIFLIISLVLLLVFGIPGIAIIMLLYILISILFRKKIIHA